VNQLDSINSKRALVRSPIFSEWSQRPEEDFARYYDQLAGGESAYFVWLNRGKESVCLDLTRGDDKALHAAGSADAPVPTGAGHGWSTGQTALSKNSDTYLKMVPSPLPSWGFMRLRC
jgi:hypothetical protein